MPRAKKVEGSPSTKAKLKIGDLRKVDPLNESQKKFFDFYNDASKQIIMAHGVAGTGKTYIAMYKALESVLNKEFEKVLIIRSAVQSREIGHLPGDLEEKLEQYQLPYKHIASALFTKKADNLVYPDPYDRLMSQGNLDFASTSFVRGLTFDNTIVIVDECQNLNFHELDSIITRVGENTKIIFCGDAAQSDLVKTNERNGILDFKKIILSMVDDFESIEFDVNDIVRSGLVRNYLLTKIALGM